jgi:hypothetical protein
LAPVNLQDIVLYDSQDARNVANQLSDLCSRFYPE